MRTDIIQLTSMASLEVLKEAVNKLCLEVEVLRDERDEYKRKWEDTINKNNAQIKLVKE